MKPAILGVCILLAAGCVGTPSTQGESDDCGSFHKAPSTNWRGSEERDAMTYMGPPWYGWHCFAMKTTGTGPVSVTWNDDRETVCALNQTYRQLATCSSTWMDRAPTVADGDTLRFCVAGNQMLRQVTVRILHISTNSIVNEYEYATIEPCGTSQQF